MPSAGSARFACGSVRYGQRTTYCHRAIPRPRRSDQANDGANLANLRAELLALAEQYELFAKALRAMVAGGSGAVRGPDGRQAANRPQGTRAPGCAPTFANADVRAEDLVPAGRHVPLQSLSPARKRVRRRPIHSAPAAARIANRLVQPDDDIIDRGYCRRSLLRRCRQFQPDFQTRVRLHPQRGSVCRTGRPVVRRRYDRTGELAAACNKDRFSGNTAGAEAKSSPEKGDQERHSRGRSAITTR